MSRLICELPMAGRTMKIIGEAAYQVSQAGRDELPGIPWEDMIGIHPWSPSGHHDLFT